jgi:hypothetical protein
MMAYLLPVLMLSIVALLLNHQAIVSSSSPIEAAAPSLQHIVRTNKNQTPSKEKARLDFIVAGFPKCVSVCTSNAIFSLYSFTLDTEIVTNNTNREQRHCSTHFWTTTKLRLPPESFAV